MNINDVIAQKLTASWEGESAFVGKEKLTYRGLDGSWVHHYGQCVSVTWTLIAAEDVPQEDWVVEKEW
jgi:hypothetical protein